MANIKETVVTQGKISKIIWKQNTFTIVGSFPEKGASCDHLFTVPNLEKFYD